MSGFWISVQSPGPEQAYWLALVNGCECDTGLRTVKNIGCTFVLCACAAIVTSCAYDHIGITIAVGVAREVDPEFAKNATSS
jgi:hypothetical protein